MLRSRRTLMPMLAVSIILSIGLVLQFPGAAWAALIDGTVYADGYYDSAGGAFIFSGARSDMECSFPVVRDGGFSAMRVGVTHKNLRVVRDFARKTRPLRGS